jgi:hypothetical protein
VFGCETWSLALSEDVPERPKMKEVTEIGRNIHEGKLNNSYSFYSVKSRRRDKQMHKEEMRAR